MNASIIDATLALVGALGVIATAMLMFSTSRGERFTGHMKTETSLQNHVAATVRKAA
ncbi:hypothetical protein [Candidatus Nitronereus thalassa]|uniref:Uncharacterized protein n=1 Tax=Candidatus Nitronereus thalassa TaxID=3020898 RepID=A0ABU3K5M5_9BACT|nr:hypothetical protein [Candidatus Nitronereus thalassa]MDT7041717.1 hypothetical protein [Candidatus Nitronereus thalassa]